METVKVTRIKKVKRTTYGLFKASYPKYQPVLYFACDLEYELRNIVLYPAAERRIIYQTCGPADTYALSGPLVDRNIGQIARQVQALADIDAIGRPSQHAAPIDVRVAAS